MRATRAAAVLVLAGLAGAACHSKGSTVLVVTVSLSGSLPPVSALDVMVIAPAATDSEIYGAPGIVFPTTLTAELPARITGDVTLDVRATDAAGHVVADGRTTFTVRVGTRQTLAVKLDCGGPCLSSAADGGATADGDAGSDAANPACGNGRIDLGETCDTAIAPGAPGACPAASCDDGIACTTDLRVGQACQARCVYTEVSERKGGDKCCPAGATNADDADCPTTCGNGVVDVGETCDTALTAGTLGACPTATACDDGDPCTEDVVRAADTCGALCTHVPITVQSGPNHDGCCPAGAWHAADVDCPSACGDGRLDPDEECDPGLPSSDPHACPVACDDGQPCTLDVRVGSACHVKCMNTPITAFVSGDGCCPAGATSRTDRDCTPSCGNGVVEPGESCDDGPMSADPCPKSCPPSPSACLKNVLAGDAATCTARCEPTPLTACGPTRDGCCAAGCTPANDPDCSPTCGDGVVEAGNGETCDVAIAPGKPGACPTSCADAVGCTRDILVAAGTCQAACLFLPITTARAGDGCCPQGADASLDPDCAPLCGNGVVEPPGETCDYGVGEAACPVVCTGGDMCSPVRLEGAKGTCSARCVPQPVTACAAGDDCCPAGCTIARDADCPIVCGDGVRSPGEACDRAITAGQPGACARTCDDGDACTSDWASGSVEGCSRACSHAAITACRGGDGCCPPGCDAKADPDCGPTCGDGQLGAGETCDPPSTCPSTCPDDGDPCTREVLAGDAAHCTAACRHDPVTACSGGAADFCCPTGCTAATDADCAR
jgi:cysteine-rich repeat protein